MKITCTYNNHFNLTLVLYLRWVLTKSYDYTEHNTCHSTDVVSFNGYLTQNLMLHLPPTRCIDNSHAIIYWRL